MSAFDTGRWTGIGAITLLTTGLAVLFQRPALLLVGVVGVAYAAYARAGEAPDPALVVERTLSDPTPDVDDEVTVTVRVRNAGDATLADLRLVDGVPPALAVTDGSPRLGTAIRPGKRATLRYAVTATRGEHEWEPIRVVTRNASGSRERAVEVGPESATVLRCTPTLSATADLPLRGLTTQYVGRVSTSVGGTGLEFHSVRRYRAGDPRSRIDWNRFARTGELSTLQFREERAATVVLLVDARREAYVGPGEDAQNAVERGVDAAGRAFTALLDSGDRVGVAAFAPGDCWLPPGTGADHRVEARRLLATHPALAPTPTEGEFAPLHYLRRLRRRLPADAQVLLFSPVADDYLVTVARRLDAYGHLVTVVSPDPTVDDTTGHRLARVERRNRLSSLRRAGIRVVDWGEGSLAAALARAEGRWSG